MRKGLYAKLKYSNCMHIRYYQMFFFTHVLYMLMCICICKSVLWAGGLFIRNKLASYRLTWLYKGVNIYIFIFITSTSFPKGQFTVFNNVFLYLLVIN